MNNRKMGGMMLGDRPEYDEGGRLQSSPLAWMLVRNKQAAPAPVALPMMINPMTQINPAYTQQQQVDSLAPMLAYQQFMQTGQMPDMSGQRLYAPHSAPQQAAQTGPAGAPSVAVGRTGGK